MSWYDESVFYHIYPLGLSGAPALNDYGDVVHRLPELEPWIDHIKEIGCNALYIGPLFESVGHGYETTDYKTLDRRLGDNEDLKHFVQIFLLSWDILTLLLPRVLLIKALMFWQKKTVYDLPYNVSIIQAQ